MSKMILVCALGVGLSGCTVATVQTHTRFPSAYTNTYTYHRPVYRHQSHYHHVYPHCRTTYQRGFYGELRAVRVSY